VGTVLGVLVSVAIERYELIRIPPDVYFVDHLPVSLRAIDLARIVTASIAISFLATIYPSRRAAALEPVDAIRHD
jgi:lipoprotein-releasing system permease protein